MVAEMIDFFIEHWFVFLIIYLIGFVVSFIALSILMVLVYREKQVGKKKDPYYYDDDDLSVSSFLAVSFISALLISAIWFIILIVAAVMDVVDRIKGEKTWKTPTI